MLKSIVKISVACAGVGRWNDFAVSIRNEQRLKTDGTLFCQDKIAVRRRSLWYNERDRTYAANRPLNAPDFG